MIGCSIVPGGDIGKGKKYCVLVTHPQFDSAIIVAASDVKIQEKWLKALREATKMRVSILTKKTFVFQKEIFKFRIFGGKT